MTHLAKQIVVTPSLTLRAFSLADAQLLFETVDRNRAHLRTYLPWVDASRELADTIRFLEETILHGELGQRYAYAICDEESLAGVIGTHDVDFVNSSASLGYWVSQEKQGLGLVTGSCRALVAQLFGVLRLERIEIRCAPENRKSAAIPERLGFTWEGTLRHAQRLPSGFTDLRVYGLLRQEWLAQQA